MSNAYYENLPTQQLTIRSRILRIPNLKLIEKIGDGEVTRQAIRDNLDGAVLEDGYSGKIVFNEDGSITRRLYYICGVNEAGEWEIEKVVTFDPADF